MNLKTLQRPVARLLVLVTLLFGVLAPSISVAASPARVTDNPLMSIASVEAFLAQADDKKLPDEDETPTSEVEEETPTPEDEDETPTPESDEDTRSSDDTLLGVLGGDRASFEDEFGAPVDDADADDFSFGEIYEDIRGYDSIQVFWDDDVALHIQLNASRDWTEARAQSQAEQFLPADVDLDEQAEELDGGELLYLGSSDALADVVGRSVYRDLEVGGRSGDLRVILIPGEDDRFATVDLAIGQGDEFSGGAGRETQEPTEEATEESTREAKKTPRATEESTGPVDADEYLADIRDEVDTRQTELDRFYEIVGLGSDASDAEFTELIDLVTGWVSLPTYEAPKGYEEIDDAYQALSDSLSSASINFTLFITDPENDSALDDTVTQLTAAQESLTELDGLLTDEGV